MRALFFALLGLLIATPALAGETRSAPEGHVPPPATIDQLAWLEGHWAGAGIDGAPAQEAYSAPAGGTITGHFVQEDGKGGVAFIELLQVKQVAGSLAYRLKHFSGELAGWEAADKFVSFPLVALGENAAWFDGLTLRLDGPDTLVAAVLVRHDDGTLDEYVFRYSRAD